MARFRTYSASIKRLLVYIAAPVFTLAIMGMSTIHQQQKRTAAVEISIDNPNASTFLDSADIHTLLGSEQQLTDIPASQVNLAALENKLKATEYVHQAQVWFAANGTLKVRVKLRRPIARFLDHKRNSFYLDDKLTVMPLHRNRTARTLMVYGYCTEHLELGATEIDQPKEALLPIIEYIDQSDVLKKQIADIFVHKNNRITLMPEFGNLPIELGEPTQGIEKLKKLEHFLTHVLPKSGWKHYRQIDLSYAGQIVAKKDTKDPLQP